MIPNDSAQNLNRLQNSTSLGTNCRSLDIPSQAHTHIQGWLLGGGSDQEYANPCGVAQATQITHKLLITGLVPGNDSGQVAPPTRQAHGANEPRTSSWASVHKCLVDSGRIVGNGLQNTVLGDHLVQALEDILSLAVGHDRSHSYTRLRRSCW